MTACINGYYGDGNICTACPADTYLTTWTSSSTVADCTACATGYTTAGAVGQTSCGSCSSGYYGDGSSCTGCPADSYSSSWSSSIATASDCSSCATGYTTEGATAQTSCGSCINGYYGDGSTCTACPADTYLTTWTSSSTIADCTACATGYTTAGAVGQPSCGEIII